MSVSAPAFIRGQGNLTGIAVPQASLVYFQVSGNFYDVETPYVGGTTNQPQFNEISAFITFYARVPVGFLAYIPTAGIALAPITGRIMNGALSTIDRPNTPGVRLVANSTIISTALQTIDPSWLTSHGLTAGELVYDVAFTDVNYAGSSQTITNFAFVAPTDTTPVNITSPALTRLTYQGP